METAAYKFDPKQVKQGSKKIVGCNLAQSVEAILINPPWAVRDPNGAGVTVDDFARIPFDKSLIHDGIVFVWAEKVLIHPLMKAMAAKGFDYIENVVWGFLDRDRVGMVEEKSIDVAPAFARQDYVHLKKAHRTLFMFRRKLTKPLLNLRHQRTCDSCFDFVDPTNSQFTPSEYIYRLIETLLPDSRLESNNSLKLLELWADESSARPGWLKLVEKNLC